MKFIIFGAIFLYLVMIAGMYVMQRSLQYLPQRGPLDVAALGVPDLQRVTLKTADGETLTAFYKPPPAGAPTILYLHGNGGSIGTRPHKIGYYASSPFGLLALSYRGYGDSTGTPSEQGFMQDAVASYDWLKKKTAGDVLVVGESIGSGVAVQLAAAKPVRALALEAPYANAVDVGAARYWFLPVRLLMKDQFRSSEYIGNINAPLLIQHGTEDTTIPFAQGKQLFDLAKEPKQFVELRGAGHDAIADERVWEREIEFFRKVMSGG